METSHEPDELKLGKHKAIKKAIKGGILPLENANSMKRRST